MWQSPDVITIRFNFGLPFDGSTVNMEEEARGHLSRLKGVYFDINMVQSESLVIR